MTSGFGVGCLEVAVDDHGVALVTFDRPPVNAVSVEVYEAIGEVADRVEASAVRCLVLAAPVTARAWCGGADLNDFVGMDSAARARRYEHINASLPRLYRLDRPTIAAITGHAVGIGVILAAMCDLRIAASEARFSCPEIDFGLVAGGAGLLASLKLPEAIVREMLFTGRRFAADELHRVGFFNDVVPRDDVVPRALALAREIAGKSLPVLRARKTTLVRGTGEGWMDAYLLAQRASAALADGDDPGEGVRAFLDHRPPSYTDR